MTDSVLFGDQKLLFVFLIVSCCISRSHQGPHETKLLAALFGNRSRHQIRSRPVIDDGKPVQVSMTMAIQNILDVDEKKELLHMNLWLNYKWYDYSLVWNASDYGNVASLSLPPELLWKPDVIIYNSAAEEEKQQTDNAPDAMIDSDGQVIWVPHGVYISSCPIDIRWFPFDTQHCTLKFGSWAYNSAKLNLTSRRNDIDLSTYQVNGEWDIIETQAQRVAAMYAEHGEFIDVLITLHIRRRPLYYIFNLIIPCILITCLSLLTFSLPPDAGEKVSLSITIMLSLYVMSLMVADMIPASSDAVSIIGLYFGGVQAMCTMSVVMAILVLKLHHRNPSVYKMSPLIRRVICHHLARLLKMPKPKQGVVCHDSNKQLSQNIHVANGMDSAEKVRLVKDLRQCDVIESSQQMHLLTSVLEELRVITSRMQRDEERGDEIDDWQYAAMVVDRLCFWLFAAFFTCFTLLFFWLGYS